MLLALKNINIFGKAFGKLYCNEYLKFKYSAIKYEFWDDESQLDICYESSLRNRDNITVFIFMNDPVFEKYDDPTVAAQKYCDNLIKRTEAKKEEETKKKLKEIQQREESDLQNKIKIYKSLDKELKEKGLI